MSCGGVCEVLPHPAGAGPNRACRDVALCDRNRMPSGLWAGSALNSLVSEPAYQLIL